MLKKELLQIILPEYEQVELMQSEKVLRLPAKVGYSIGRNFAEAKKVANAKQRLINKLFEENVTKKDGLYQQNEKGGWLFKEADGQYKIDHAVAMWGDEEAADLRVFTIAAAEIQAIDNFPIGVLSTLLEYGIVVDAPELKVVPNGKKK